MRSSSACGRPGALGVLGWGGEGEEGWAASAVEVESHALLSLSVDVLDSHEQVVDRHR